MSHIKVTSRRKNPDLKYLDRIYLTDDHSIYVNLNTWTIVHINEKGEEHTESKSRKPEYFYMLRELIEKNGMIISPDTIFEISVSGKARDKFELKVDEKVSDIYKELRRQDFCKEALKKGLSLKKHSLKDDGINGYILELPPQGNNLYEDFDVDEEPLRPVFTDTIVPDTNDIIYRDMYVEQIKKAVAAGVKAISICGFGGLGKTSVAQILYKEYANSDDKTFEHIGYVSYRGDLKTSITTAMSYLYEGMNARDIWKHLAVRLKNNKRKKVLIIDNVDRDNKLSQDPLNESEAEVFQEISGWPNLTVILTSRLEEIPGFTSYPISTLGNDDDPQPCIELFNLYNNKFKDETDIIRKIVKYCNYHTYAIELVAKSTRTRKSLKKFYQEFKNEKYNATSLAIKTTYRKFDNNTTAAIQIMKLFDISSRNVSDRKILESFALLPDMEQVSDSEMEGWFTYTPNDVIPLVEEGWMQCYKGQYYVHPLVKEAILLGCNEKKLPEKAAGNIISGMEDETFFCPDEEYQDMARKVRICDSILEHVTVKEKIRQAAIALNLANRARKISNRVIALRQYEEAESVYRKIEKELNSEEKVSYWKAKYYRGYVLSYTSGKFAEAETYLKEALLLSEELYTQNPTRKNKEHLATSWDHYGYVLSNYEKDKEAEICLRKGLEIRRELENEYPTEYKQMVAWSADNLGFLLSFQKEAREEGEELLIEALKYREELGNGDEVAWTCSNLACLYLLGGYNYEEAEQLMKNALFEYEELEQISPESHYASMAYICNNYGMLLLSGFQDWEGAVIQLKKSLKMYRKLEEDYPESYFQETAMVCNNIANLLQLYFENMCQEIEAYYQEAITILEDKYKNSAKLKGDKSLAKLLADINYNYWVYMLRDMKYADERRKNRRDALNYWKKSECNINSKISYFMENYRKDEMSGNVVANYAQVFYVQGGARKKRIWSNDFIFLKEGKQPTR